MVVAALALATWVFLRAQGVETWEANRAQRWIIALAIAVIFFFPILFADSNYDNRAPAPNNAPALRGLSWRGSSSLGLTPPGGQLPAHCCSPILNHNDWPSLFTDQNTRRDLFILLPVEASQHITDVHIEVAGENGLQVAADPGALAAASQHLEARTYPNDLGPAAPDGHHVATGWVARVPVSLDPTQPWDTGGMRYPLSATVTYRVEGDNQPRMLKARAAIEAQIGSAIWTMGVASFIVPLICFAAFITRWRRTR